MDGITELAKHIRARDNPSSYTPMFGKIISLPELKKISQILYCVHIEFVVYY
jgi:hypothetical protein